MLLDYFEVSNTDHLGVHLLYTPRTSVLRGPTDSDNVKATIERCLRADEVFIPLLLRDPDRRTKFASQMAYCTLQGKDDDAPRYRIVTVFPGAPGGESLAGDVYRASIEQRSFSWALTTAFPAFLVAVLL